MRCHCGAVVQVLQTACRARARRPVPREPRGHRVREQDALTREDRPSRSHASFARTGGGTGIPTVRMISRSLRSWMSTMTSCGLTVRPLDRQRAEIQAALLAGFAMSILAVNHRMPLSSAPRERDSFRAFATRTHLRREPEHTAAARLSDPAGTGRPGRRLRVHDAVRPADASRRYRSRKPSHRSDARWPRTSDALDRARATVRPVF